MTEVDDIQSFIAVQKRRIEEERVGLSQQSVGNRNGSHRNYEPDYPTPQDHSINVARQEQPKAPKEDTTSTGGLPLGSYEGVQEKLRKERAEEYRKFLAEKNFRSTGKKVPSDRPVEKPAMKSALKQDYDSPRAPRSNTMNPGPFAGGFDDPQRRPLHDSSAPRSTSRAARPQKTLDELYDAYEELLERKRQDERRYRGSLEDPHLDPRHVRFQDESRYKAQKEREPWLENGTRRRWDSPVNDFNRLGGQRRHSGTDQQDSRNVDNFQERPRGRKQDQPDDRMSRSAPPTAVPLFGEHNMSPEVKQQRQTKYRQELEAQMKEREMQKKREKNQMFMDDSRKHNKAGSNPLTNGESTPVRYQPSFPRNDEARHEQPRSGPADLPSQRYQAQNDRHFNQFAYDQAYNYPYLHQPLNYPPSLLSTGPPLSTLHPSAGMLGGYPMPLREPLGGYQPSWAHDNTALGKGTAGLGASFGDKARLDDRNAPVSSRLNQSTSSSDKGLSSSGRSGFGALPLAEDGRGKDRSKQESYREELRRQMVEKEARKKKDREDVEKYNLKLERELEEYNPWGKSGGGAPIRDQTGRLVSDLRTMHQYNKEGTIISPRDRGKSAEPSLAKENLNLSNEIKSAGSTASPIVDQFQQSPVQTVNEGAQKNAQQEYKDYLRQQMEEKQRKKKEEEDRLRESEERQDKIIQEQQKKLKEEYEKELQAARQKEEAARQKNEELRRAAEEKKKEIERKRLEEDRKQEEKLKKQLEERLKAAKAANRSDSSPLPSTQYEARSNSPPIPTLQKRVEESQRSASPPIPTLQNRTRSDSPPIPTHQNKEKEDVPARPSVQRQPSIDQQLTRPSSSAKRDPQKPSTPATYQAQNNHQGRRSRPSSTTADVDVLGQLTSLRRQLKNEEVKVQQQLSENKEKYVKLRENSGTRRNKKPAGTVFDNVFRKQSSGSQKYHDAQSAGAIDEFHKLKYEENSSLHGDFLTQYPEPATSSSTLDLQQKSLLQEQQKRLQTFRYKVLTSDKENVESFGNSARPPSNTSQLESDSQFVPVNDPSQVPQVDNLKQSSKMPSARERRRWKQLENLAKAPKLSDYKPPTPGGFSLNSVTSFNVDEVAQKNEERLRRLEAMKQARAESKGDPDEVLKRFIQQHSRPDSKVSENSLPADKRHLPNM